MSHPSRRDLLQAGALLVGGSLLGSCRTSPTTSDDSIEDAGTLRLAGYPFDRVRGLVAGKATIDGLPTHFEKSSIGKLNSTAMGGDQRYDIQEIGLHPYMLAYANDGLRDYTLLPVFPLRTFRHKSMFVRADSGIHQPADLRGRKVCTAGYSQSSLTWIRGLLQDEYGLRPQDMHWVLARSSSEGGVSGNEQRLPEGVSMTQGPVGKNESELLMHGSVDAVLSAKEPQAYISGDPGVVRLFPDFRRVERAYYKKTGIFPIMHAVAIRRSLLESRPALAQAAYQAYLEAKNHNYIAMRDTGWAMNALPWYAQELEETRSLMGEDFWPYGIRANRKALETLFRYSHEQGLCQRRLTIDELFAPTTLAT